MSIQAVSFGNHEKRKGPTVGGTIGMATLGAVGGGGVYVAKNFAALKDCVEIDQAAKKAGGFFGNFTNFFTDKVLSKHKTKFLKFAGIGAAIMGGLYLVTKTISAVANKNS